MMMALKNSLKILCSCSRSFIQVQPVVRCSSNKSKKPVPLKSKKEKSRRTYLPHHYVDSLQIRTVAGKGGNGCVSFLQLFANDKAGPDGGDGGHGGHVIFRASRSVKDLSRINSNIRAENGEKGYNKNCYGKNAKHCFVDVPVGTIIRNSKGTVVGDLTHENAMFIAARGGSGGRGNRFFVSDVNQAPEVAEVGANGEEISYTLEVKSMAHFGLVGLPNAGKSTLLRAISRARPEVADYEFTTLRPHLGVIKFSDFEQIVVADLPGLIEGSHENKGMGLQFLKHTERCLGLLYVIDMSREPMSQLEILRNELLEFSPEMLNRPNVYVGNKMDLPEAEKNLQIFRSEFDNECLPISAMTGKNLDLLLHRIRDIYDENLVIFSDSAQEDEWTP